MIVNEFITERDYFCCCCKSLLNCQPIVLLPTLYVVVVDAVVRQRSQYKTQDRVELTSVSTERPK